MKQNILFMTVGTGFGIDGYKSLANGLCTSITYINPHKVVFFVTERSYKTVDYLKEIYFDKENEELDSYELVTLDNPDDFSNCFEIISNKISEYSNSNIIVDYTSGTKTMSVTIAIAAILNHHNIMSITGERNKGVITPNTEGNKTQNPYRVYDYMHFENFKEHFNNNRFESAKNSLSKIISLFDDETKNLLNEFIDMYLDWDKFHHSKYRLNSENNLFKDFNKQLQLNLKSLSIISNEKSNLSKNYLIADLLNNAERRFLEGKYDDASARLYRSLELIAQTKLSKKYSIDTSNVDLEVLKKFNIEEVYLNELDSKRKGGKIKLGLSDSYNLLYNLNDELGLYYIENEKRYMGILKIRNSSILAHGIKPVSAEKYSEFKELVINVAKILIPNLDDLLEETKFPKFL